jgi:hypothetical protein
MKALYKSPGRSIRMDGNAFMGRTRRAWRTREDILLFGEEKFGPPDESVQAQLNTVTDLNRLKRMVRRAAKAVSWLEILETP